MALRFLLLNSKLLLLTLILLVASSGLSSCADNSKEIAYQETATSGSLEFEADEVLRPAIDSLVEGFMRENPKAKITVKYVSAGKAMEDLLNQQTRLVLVARTLNTVEKQLLIQNNVTLPEFDMAQNAIGCIVSQKNPMAALAMSDLGSIVRNEVTHWMDLNNSLLEPSKGKPGGEIVRVMGPYSGSTSTLLDSIFLGPNQVQSGKVVRFQTTDSVIAFVQQDRNAIGFIGSSWKAWLDNRRDSSVKVLSIIPADSSSKGVTTPIMLHLAYVYQGLYPLTDRVSGYTFDSPNSLPRGLLAYAMNAHGQTVFLKYNVLPRTQIIKIVPSK